MLAVIGYLLSLEALTIASWGLVRLHRRRDAKRRRWTLAFVALLLLTASVAVFVRTFYPSPGLTQASEFVAVGAGAGLAAIALFLTWYLAMRVIFEWPAHASSWHSRPERQATLKRRSPPGWRPCHPCAGHATGDSS